MNYKVYQGSELKQTVTSKTAVMNGLQPNKSYVFGVQPDNGQTGAVGANLIDQSDFKYGYFDPGTGSVNSTSIDFYSENYIATNGETVFTFSSPDYVFKGSINNYDRLAMYDSNKNYLGYQPITSPTQTLSLSNVAYIRFCINSADEGNTTGSASDWLANHRYKLEKGSVATTYVATTSVTTRGIRFNIPKTLTVGSTITLRYEEYPLGIVPIGNEPSGYFGGGNKQSLSAKVISTANGSSVVEVAGNVIDVGEFNELENSMWSKVTSWYYTQGANDTSETNGVSNGVAWIKDTGTTHRWKQWQSPISSGSQANLWNKIISSPSAKVSISIDIKVEGNTIIDPTMLELSLRDSKYNNPVYLVLTDSQLPNTFTRIQATGTLPATFDGIENYRVIFCYSGNGMVTFSKPKLEFNDVDTPYASFVDGDTFTAQPDGTFALFSEYKALYY